MVIYKSDPPIYNQFSISLLLGFQISAVTPIQTPGRLGVAISFTWVSQLSNTPTTTPNQLHFGVIP